MTAVFGGFWYNITEITVTYGLFVVNVFNLDKLKLMAYSQKRSEKR